MNIDRLSLFLQRSTLLLSLVAGSFLLVACGGGDDKKSTSSSSSSSSQRSSYMASSAPNGTGDGLSLKIEATATKTLTFSWGEKAGATSYTLYKVIPGEGVVQMGSVKTVADLDDGKFYVTEEIGSHVHDWFQTYYYVETDICTENGCDKSEPSFAATEMLKAIGYLKAGNADAQDFFGWSIALSGDGQTLAVGAPSEDGNGKGADGDPDNNNSTNAGAVYVFIKEGNLWVQQAYLKASNTEQQNLNSARFLPNDRFGYRVALSDDGSTLAVSSLLEDSPSYGINCNQDNFEVTTTFDSSANSSASASSINPYDDLIQAVDNNVGAVYVFKRSGTGDEAEWTQNAYVKPEFPSPGLQFGDSLALSGDGKTLAVGASTDDVLLSGVFNYSSSSARACLEFYPSSSSSSSVSSSSNSSSSSSSTSSYKGGTDSGGVYIYIDTEAGWQSDVYLKASNAQIDDFFGASVAISKDGTTIAIGALGEDSNAIGTSIDNDQSINSCIYMENNDYKLDTTCKKNNILRNPNGSPIYANTGAVYVFTKTETETETEKLWVQQAYLKPAFAYVFTQFGTSVDLSDDGNTLAVGAVNDATFVGGINQNPATVDKNYLGAGAAYIFSRDGNTWTQEAYIKPSTVTKGTQFGLVVSLSGDGNTLAAGSYLESSAAKGINGDEGDTSAPSAGAIYIFTRDLTQWSQANYVKSKNTEEQDRFGISVDLSDDGKTMAVGAHREAGGGFDAEDEILPPEDNSKSASGAVYIY